jgi:hypothetical protein
MTVVSFVLEDGRYLNVEMTAEEFGLFEQGESIPGGYHWNSEEPEGDWRVDGLGQLVPIPEH